MANKTYPLAAGLAETESLEILVASLKKRAYPDAIALTETETLSTILGLNWFLSEHEILTESVGSASAFIKRFSTTAIASETETLCTHLALWPEPPVPTGSLSSGGKDLHKQSLRQGSSHTISFAVSFTQVTQAEIDITQLVFEMRRSTALESETPTFLKTRFGVPGGIIIDTVTETAENAFTVTGDVQLRNYQTSFPESQLELKYELKATNEAISRSADIASGTVIFVKD
jgi:hypothetical protein